MDERLSSQGDTTHYSALPIGAMLQEFQVEAVLGHGGFGITYLANDTLLDKAVAVKEFFPNELAVRASDTSVSAKSRIDEQDFAVGLQSFLEEARTLARFSHPNIVTVRRFFKANGTGYIVQEYVAGQTLSRRLNAAALEESELRKILAGLLDGLELIHDSAILHRDIKPDNIVLRDDGTPVLIDFGAARNYLGRHSRSITAIAAGGYTSPEQWGAGGQHGPWSDIYALGAVLYRCVTGASPPVSLQRLRSDPMAPAVKAAEGKYSSALLELIDWMLRVDETERPTSMAEIRVALDRGVGRPVAAPAAAQVVVEPSAPPQPRKTWLLPAAAVGALLIGAAAIGGILQQRASYEADFATIGADVPALQQFVASCGLLCPSSLNTAAQARLAAIATAKKQIEARAAAEAEEKARALAKAEADARAKAQAQRDVAERQRAALERQKAEEQARRAADDARKREAEAAAKRQAEQARSEVEEHGRQLAERQKTEAKPAAPDAATTPALQRQARLEPAAVTEAELVKSLQSELRRVGCFTGSVDGEWGAPMKNSLELFNRYAGMNVETVKATSDTIGAVKVKTGRICPLVCQHGFHADGERCVPTVCEAGFVLGGDGKCVKRAAPKRPVARAAPARSAPAGGGGSKCFTFNGSRYCE